MAPEPTTLITEAISRNGPIGFDEFMRLALYSPRGYYSRRVPAQGSDYRTAPSLSPWFGRLFALQLQQTWNEMRRPKEFTVIEVGAGGADLASAALDRAGPYTQTAFEPGFCSALHWVFIEPLEPVRKLQETRLAGPHLPVRWERSLQDLNPITGVVVANEVLDNFPVKTYEVSQEGVIEILVGLQDGHLAEVAGPLDESSSGQMQRHLEPGDRFEMCPGLDAWVQEAWKALSWGRLFVIDYGDLEPDIWARNPAGTVLTYRRENLGTDPFSCVGEADITCRVNFSALQRAAAGAGFSCITVQTQKQWLKDLGLERAIDHLRTRQKEAESRRDAAAALSILGERSRAAALAAAGGLGDFLVMTAAKQQSQSGKNFAHKK